ncbi:ribosome assembly factor SBDS [Candidatus Woesearchaeota archaeon]|nr:ribosome assembly factor SBDS [Candidatus Woesearchaeota archaeon]
MHRQQIFDKERVSFNLARLKKGGSVFEVAVDPDLAIEFKKGKAVDIKDVLRSEKIFSDVSRGVFAAETQLKAVFGSTDVLRIATTIMKEGEIQLTAEYREKLREEKRKRIITIIARNAIDPQTKFPHPPQRIENAMAEAKIKIDEYKTAEEQVDPIVKQLRPILPISFEQRKIAIRIPATHAGKAINAIMQFAKPQQEKWNDDGSYSCVIEIPAGLEADFYDRLNKLTHGGAETRVIQ